MTEIIKIGTRGSQLALYQANKTKKHLSELFPDLKFEIQIIKTKGDKILDTALSKIGDKGLFTKEIEVALLNNEIDLAVHSLKDLPTELPKGLELSAVIERGEFRDALVSLNGKKLSNLTEKDIIATSSLRRKAQILKINPKLKVIDIRGNVNTRIKKLKENYCNVTIMATAGLQRLNMDEYISDILNPAIFMPAVSQGIIGIEIRQGDKRIQSLMKKLNHAKSWLAAIAERKFLAILEGGCQIPVACYTEQSDTEFTIHGSIAMPDGSFNVTDKRSGKLSEAVSLAEELGKYILNNGGKKVLESLR